MSEGLITRIGKWLDEKMEPKLTLETVRRDLSKALENELVQAYQRIGALERAVSELGANKDLADLKTRIERLEVGTGMYRKVDPTKAPVAKSAFQM